MAGTSTDSSTKRTATTETLVVRGKAAWTSEIDTDVVVEATGRLAVNGDIAGGLELRPGAKVAVKGDVHGDIFVGEAAQLAVKGSVTGSVTNRGGTVAVDDSDGLEPATWRRLSIIGGAAVGLAGLGLAAWLTRDRW